MAGRAWELTETEKTAILQHRRNGRFGRLDPRRISKLMKIPEDKIRCFLGLAPKCVSSPKHRGENRIRHDAELNRASVPASVMAEWERRRAAEHESICAVLCGDPPVGFRHIDIMDPERRRRLCG